MPNEANALNENHLLSLECRLQKGQSPVYMAHRSRGRQDGGVGFGGHGQASPAWEVREELAFVLGDPEAWNTELGHAHSDRTDNWAKGKERGSRV